MLNVGLTGNIAAGKSAVAARLAEHGAVVLDADAYARAAVAPGTPGFARVVERFGTGVLWADGSLNREALGRIVFADAVARRDLEAIVHPEVARLRAIDAAEAAARGVEVVVSDIPLLFEIGLERAFDAVVLVDASEATRLERLMRVRGLAEADALAVMRAQGDAAAKRARATHVIANDGTLPDLHKRVDALWPQLQAAARARRTSA